MTQQIRDLGLDYLDALHGIQSALAFESDRTGKTEEWKHLRVGVDSNFITHAAVADLLIARGVFTKAEYIEAVRLRANSELADFQEKYGMTFR